jgi:spore coat protein U-like protein
MFKPVISQRLRSLACVTLLAAAGTSTGAFAASDNVTFQVKAKILANCLVQSIQATDMDFGIDKLTSESKVIVSCTTDLPYQIGLSGGDFSSGAGTADAPVLNSRRMKSTTGDAFIGYELFQDPGRSIFWGNTLGINTRPGKGDGKNQEWDVYGRRQAASVPAGDYFDDVVATITY